MCYQGEPTQAPESIVYDTSNLSPVWNVLSTVQEPIKQNWQDSTGTPEITVLFFAQNIHKKPVLWYVIGWSKPTNILVFKKGTAGLALDVRN